MSTGSEYACFWLELGPASSLAGGATAGRLPRAAAAAASAAVAAARPAALLAAPSAAAAAGDASRDSSCSRAASASTRMSPTPGSLARVASASAQPCRSWRPSCRSGARASSPGGVAAALLACWPAGGELPADWSRCGAGSAGGEAAAELPPEPAEPSGAIGAGCSTLAGLRSCAGALVLPAGDRGGRAGSAGCAGCLPPPPGCGGERGGTPRPDPTSPVCSALILGA